MTSGEGFLPGVLLRAGARELRCAALLVAAGRRPQKLETLGLEKAAVKYSKDGHSVAPDLPDLSFVKIMGFNSGFAWNVMGFTFW